MLYLEPHQKFIVDSGRKKAPIALSGGGGKTIIALCLATGKTLVVCPKQQRDDKTWQRNRDKFNLNVDLTVISKEEMRRDWNILPAYETLIIDESHTVLGMSPSTVTRKGIQIPKTSQIFSAVENYIKKHNPERMYFCSGTPIPHPMNLYAHARLFGKKWDFYKFRERFYVKRLIGFRELWIEKKDKASKDYLVKLFKETLGAFTGQLSDWFEVQEQKHKTIYVDLTHQQKEAIDSVMKEESDPMIKKSKIRGIENGVIYSMENVELNDKESILKKSTTYLNSNKLDAILDLQKKWKKVIVFANYTGQIKRIYDFLTANGVHALTLTGKTKSEDRKTIIETAENTPSCVLIVQCSISAGWELKTARCMVFASKSYKFVDYQQALWRNLRLDNVAEAKNTYYHLVVRDGPDEACHKAILSGVDFQERLMYNE